MAVASPQMLIADLRRWLACMGSHGRASAAVLPFDITDVDAHVPGGGLQLGHLHEVHVVRGGDRDPRGDRAQGKPQCAHPG